MLETLIGNLKLQKWPESDAFHVFHNRFTAEVQGNFVTIIGYVFHQ